MKKLLLILTISLATLGCSKDDSIDVTEKDCNCNEITEVHNSGNGNGVTLEGFNICSLDHWSKNFITNPNKQVGEVYCSGFTSN